MPSSNKIQVYLPARVLEELKKLAVEQNRSASNLAATYVIQAIEADPQPSYSEAIALLKTLARGEIPSDAAIILAAHEIDDIEPEQLFDLRDRLFKKGKQSNGV
jgi:phage gp36-like protein